MEKIDRLIKLEEAVKSFTIDDFRNPELVAQLTKIHILLEDIFATIRLPMGTGSIIDLSPHYSRKANVVAKRIRERKRQEKKNGN